MPLFVVTELNAGRTAESTADGGRTAARRFDVLSSAGNTSPLLVLQAPGLPRKGDMYVSADGTVDSRLWCEAVTATLQDETQSTFFVEARYTSKSRQKTVRWGTFRKPKVRDKDLDDKNILNSAYMPFDPPVEIDEVGLKLTVVRWQAAYDALYYLEYIDSVNDGPWPTPADFNRGHVRIADITAESAAELGIDGWRVTFELEVLKEISWAESPWQANILDCGFREYDEAAEALGEEANPFIFVKGRPLTHPARLDGHGKKLEPATADSVFLTFTVHPYKDFGPLGLTLPP